MEAETPAGWTMARLSDLVDGRGITYGVVQPGRPVINGTPVLRVANFADGRMLLDDVLRIDPQIADRYQRSRLVGGEVLITLVGSVGEVAVATKDVAGWNVARAVGVIPVKRTESAAWVAACLQSPEIRARLATRFNTTVQTTLNLKDLAACQLPMPPPPEQEAIIKVLRGLDDKIESNQRLVLALERCAALQVQHATREAETQSIYEVASITYGAPFSSKLFVQPGDGLPLIRIRDLRSQIPGIWTTENRLGARLIVPGDIVVGMDAEFRAHLWAGRAGWLNQRVCAFDPFPGVSRAYLLEVIKRPLAFYEATKGGTTVIHLGKRDIDEFRVPQLAPEVMAELRRDADPLLAHAVGLRRERDSLTAVRDALLPKLVFGRIRVPLSDDVEEQVGVTIEALT